MAGVLDASDGQSTHPVDNSLGARRFLYAEIGANSAKDSGNGSKADAGDAEKKKRDEHYISFAQYSRGIACCFLLLQLF